jgi:hypothetical protein
MFFPKVIDMEEKVCDAYCHNCIYFGGHGDPNWCCCNYFLLTDKRRPCPPGKGCTVKQKAKRKMKTAAEYYQERRMNNDGA